MNIASNDNVRSPDAYRAANDNAPTMRELIAHRPAPRAPQPTPSTATRFPLQEEFKAGRFSQTHGLALDWWIKTHSAAEVGNSIGTMRLGGVSTPFISRPPGALFAQELAAERSLTLGRVYQRLGPLALVIEAALEGAEMRELAPPAIPIPKEKRPAAGRIRLGAGLDIVHRYSESGCSAREALEITLAAADACWALAAKRRLRAANDNGSQVAAAA